MASVQDTVVNENDQTPAAPDVTSSLPIIESDPGPDTTEVPTLEPGIYLVGSDGKQTIAIPISEGTVRLGRGFAAEIQIDDPTLSRRHAIIVHENDATTVLDDRSANGTFVNGVQITRQNLSHGDKVTFGRITMRYIVQAR
ncbi:MAG TPA: FHA domain-containing protein [Baekduia sp.]|nr:FHA domain-containing protein [Baekduia sp.]